MRVNDERSLLSRLRRFGRSRIRSAAQRPKKLKYCGGRRLEGVRDSKYMPCYDPSTGAVIAYAPQCTAEEVEEAIRGRRKGLSRMARHAASPSASRCCSDEALLDEHLEELTYLCAQENGKKWDEAMGDVLKVIEVVEFACRRAADDEGRVADERLRRATTRCSSASRWACSPASRRGIFRP